MERTNVAIIGQLALVHFVAKFAMKCTLCRHLHKVHYVDNPIMWSWRLAPPILPRQLGWVA